MNWKITKLHVIEVGDLSDVVMAASYEIGKITGVVMVKPPGANFIPFADLTEAQVLDWIWAEIDKTGIEARAAAAAAPITQSAEKPLPWMGK